MVAATRISSLLLSLTTLAISLSISDSRYPSSNLDKRFVSSCPQACTSCPNGKFEPFAVISGLNAGAYQYGCHTSENSGSCCTPPDGCAPNSNLPPPGFHAEGSYCPKYCVDCPGGYYNATESLPPGQIYFKCAVGCSGIKPGGECVPPIPATCPIPAPTLGWCGMHITQYQKMPQDPGAKDPGDPNFMFDFKVYDAQGWNIGMISGVSIATGTSYAFNVTGLNNGPIRAQARAFDDDPVDLSYNGHAWNTGTNAENGKNPNFSEVGVYATPGTEARDKAGQREIDTGFEC